MRIFLTFLVWWPLYAVMLWLGRLTWWWLTASLTKERPLFGPSLDRSFYFTLGVVLALSL